MSDGADKGLDRARHPCWSGGNFNIPAGKGDLARAGKGEGLDMDAMLLPQLALSLQSV